MPLTLTARKAAVAAFVCIALFFLLRSSPPKSPPPPSIGSLYEGEKQGVPTRSYPPPSKDQQSLQDSTTKSLRERLGYHFAYDIESRFPAYIWQTWKTAPGAGAFEARLRPFEASWSGKNPGFVHEVITDEAAPHLINYLYGSVPEVVEAYDAMPLPVLKADFFRYLILLARGGIYSDIDTTALKPATEWLPSDFDKSTVGIVVGIEADPDRPDWQDWYARRIQFCQWTIQSKPGHPILREIVAAITEKTLTMKREQSFLTGKALTKSIMDFTGPGIWTDTIFNYMNNKDYFDFSNRLSNISYPDFFSLKEPKKVGDVIVLPITSFSPGVNQMGAGDTMDPLAFVKHEFDGEFCSSFRIFHLHRYRKLETRK